MTMAIRLFHGDCLKEMDNIEDGSVSMCLTDLPYGVLNSSNENAKWDCQIPIEPLWEQWLRVCKPNAAIVLFAQGMFTAELMMSRRDFWRYNLIWEKGRATGFLNAKRMPLRSHEDICIFYRKLPTYNPQMTKSEKGQESHSKGRTDKSIRNSCYGDFVLTQDGDLTMKYPQSVLRFKRDAPTEVVHPTQKPVDLCRWLIRTYTNEGDVVLDSTMGSGTTGVAAVLEGRNFVGIEKDEKYFKIAEERIKKVVDSPTQQELNI